MDIWQAYATTLTFSTISPRFYRLMLHDLYLISAYLQLLTYLTREEETCTRKMYLFETMTSSRKISQKRKPENFEILIFPIHLHDHWVLGAVHWNEKIICTYDTLSTQTHEVDLMEIKVSMADFFMGLGGGDNWTLQSVKCPQQLNGSDCGVLLLGNARNLIIHRNLMDGTEADAFRVQIIDSIENRRINFYD